MGITENLQKSPEKIRKTVDFLPKLSNIWTTLQKNPQIQKPQGRKEKNMRYKILIEDRKDIVNAMEAATGEKPEYIRMPRCAYILRGIAVEKTATSPRRKMQTWSCSDISSERA